MNFERGLLALAIGYVLLVMLCFWMVIKWQ